jgi:hypothetical protein
MRGIMSSFNTQSFDEKVDNVLKHMGGNQTTFELLSALSVAAVIHHFDRFVEFSEKDRRPGPGPLIAEDHLTADVLRNMIAIGMTTVFAYCSERRRGVPDPDKTPQSVPMPSVN